MSLETLHVVRLILLIGYFVSVPLPFNVFQKSKKLSYDPNNDFKLC